MGEELVTQGLDIQVIVTGVVGLITTVTSGWVSWLFAKKKYNAEVDTNLIENMLKRDGNLITPDYYSICFDYISNETVTSYRKKCNASVTLQMKQF